MFVLERCGNHFGWLVTGVGIWHEGITSSSMYNTQKPLFRNTFINKCDSVTQPTHFHCYFSPPHHCLEASGGLLFAIYDVAYYVGGGGERGGGGVDESWLAEMSIQPANHVKRTFVFHMDPAGVLGLQVPPISSVWAPLGRTWLFSGWHGSEVALLAGCSLRPRDIITLNISSTFLRLNDKGDVIPMLQRENSREMRPGLGGRRLILDRVCTLMAEPLCVHSSVPSFVSDSLVRQ